MKQSLFFCHFGVILLAGVCLYAPGVRAEKMVALNARGELLDMRSSQVRALAKENLRISQVKKAFRERKISSDELLAKIYQPLLAGNKKQFEANIRNAKKFRSRAMDAKKQDQMEAANRYMKVAKLFFDYSKQNKRILEAYSQGDPSQISLSCGEIMNIEKQIKAVARKEVPRDWFTPQELNKIRIVSAKVYEKMREVNEVKTSGESSGGSSQSTGSRE